MDIETIYNYYFHDKLTTCGQINLFSKLDKEIEYYCDIYKKINEKFLDKNNILMTINNKKYYKVLENLHYTKGDKQTYGLENLSSFDNDIYLIALNSQRRILNYLDDFNCFDFY